MNTAIRLRQLVWILLIAGVVTLIDWDYVMILAVLLAAAVLAFETRDPLRALGLMRPRSIPVAIAAGIGIGIALIVFSKLLLTPAAEALTGVPRDLSAFDDVRGNTARFLALMPRIWIGAAIGEELVFRSFLIGRLETVFGGASRAATTTAVILSSVVFGAAHTYQGPSGVLVTGVLGLLFAIVYVASGHRAWANIIAHGVYDTASLALVLTNYDRVLIDLGHRLIPPP